MKNTIIYLLGFPGTGKLTIAKEIAKSIDAKIIHSHRINNVLFDLVGADGINPLPSGVWNKLDQIRGVVLETIEELSPEDSNFIFTNHLVEGDLKDEEVFLKVEQLAKARGSDFYPVRLLVSEEELVRRIQSPERKQNMKSINPESARRNIVDHVVYSPKNCNIMTFDVSKLLATEVAKLILSEVSNAKSDLNII